MPLSSGSNLRIPFPKHTPPLLPSPPPLFLSRVRGGEKVGHHSCHTAVTSETDGDKCQHHMQSCLDCATTNKWCPTCSTARGLNIHNPHNIKTYNCKNMLQHRPEMSQLREWHAELILRLCDPLKEGQCKQSHKNTHHDWDQAGTWKSKGMIWIGGKQWHHGSYTLSVMNTRVCTDTWASPLRAWATEQSQFIRMTQLHCEGAGTGWGECARKENIRKRRETGLYSK